MFLLLPSLQVALCYISKMHFHYYIEHVTLPGEEKRKAFRRESSEAGTEKALQNGGCSQPSLNMIDKLSLSDCKENMSRSDEVSTVSTVTRVT